MILLKRANSITCETTCKQGANWTHGARTNLQMNDDYAHDARNSVRMMRDGTRDNT
jgi:hypothetical protein